MHAQAVTDPGSSTGTAARLVLGSPAGGTIDTAEDADYFRLYFPESTHAIIEARTTNLAPISADLLDAQGREISANVHHLTVRFVFRFRHGFRILDDFGPGTYYLRVTTPAELAPRPVPYTIYAYEDEEYTEYTEECEAKTRALNDPADQRPPLCVPVAPREPRLHEHRRRVRLGGGRQGRGRHRGRGGRRDGHDPRGPQRQRKHRPEL